MSVSEDFYRRRYEELRERWNAQVSPDEKLRQANLRAAKAVAERQQAIDALREAKEYVEELIDTAADIEETPAWVLSDLGTTRGILDRALVKLGEQP